VKYKLSLQAARGKVLPVQKNPTARGINSGLGREAIPKNSE
jgi:hypothetical protein